MNVILLFLNNFSHQINHKEKNIENIIDYCENEIKSQFLTRSTEMDSLLEREFLFLGLYKNLFNIYYYEITNFIMVNLPILLNFYIFIIYTNQGTKCVKVSHKILSISYQTIIIKTKKNKYSIEIENLFRFYVLNDKYSQKYILKKFLTYFLRKLFLIQQSIDYILSITITGRCFIVFTDIPPKNFRKTNFMFISLFLHSLDIDNNYLHILIINKHEINIHYDDKNPQRGIIEFSFSNELYVMITNFTFSRSKIDENFLKNNFIDILSVELTKKVIIKTAKKLLNKTFN
ncbi:hypothetical protein CWI36_0581p0050 [Hamiltosporidium magnivora]|uniref:Uncharacterized protein n=1 Tax=Hamiltosporidium magnivora TaxID=148818 RepID=A0A4Q9LF91_9MICR|nr:hypothetical protein CWI36_0581p0050 [Hamiltosporidium magnivora]